MAAIEKVMLKNGDAGLKNGSNPAKKVPRPFMIEGESPEDREKRMAKRKVATLKVLQMAYDDYQKATSK